MNIETVFFKATDGVGLNGLLYKTNKNTKKIMISIHGMATDCIRLRYEAIAKKVNKYGIDFLTFNNRGHGIVNNIKKRSNSKIELGGSAYEEVTECYADIVGIINYAIKNNYDEIYLMGHSLGTVKLIYFYNKMLKDNKELKPKIKAVLLLSLVDIPTLIKSYLGKKYEDTLKLVYKLKEEHKEMLLLQNESFIYPLSVKNFIRYAVENDDINFAQFSNEKYSFKEINKIKVPLFMRWGNNKELILQQAEDLCEFLKTKINNPNLDIGYIDGANHSYKNREKELAEEIASFIEKIIK